MTSIWLLRMNNLRVSTIEAVRTRVPDPSPAFYSALRFRRQLITRHRLDVLWLQLRQTEKRPQSSGQPDDWQPACSRSQAPTACWCRPSDFGARVAGRFWMRWSTTCFASGWTPVMVSDQSEWRK